MTDFITKLVKDLEDAAARPEIAGGNVDYLLRTAAIYLADQQAEIGSLKAQMRDMTWENDHLRTLYDNKLSYDGY